MRDVKKGTDPIGKLNRTATLLSYLLQCSAAQHDMRKMSFSVLGVCSQSVR
jgi:hypothetical protein